MGIVLGLGAALSWGLVDYLATLASRRLGSLRVVLGFHVASTLILAMLVAAMDALGDVGWGDVPLFVLVGALGWGAYLAFYRALEIGPISIVSPIVSGYAAVTVVLSVILLGEALSGLQASAVVVAFVGVLLTSADLGQIARIERVRALGLVLAIAAMILFGGFVLGVASRVDEIGWLAPIFLARTFSAIFVAATAVHMRRFRIPLRTRIVGALFVIGALDTLGYVCFNVGVRHADTAVVATASMPYAVVPVSLGVLALHERPTRSQWVGVGLVLLGLVLLGLGS